MIPGPDEWHDDAPQGAPLAGAVNPGGLFDVVGNLADERYQHPDTESGGGDRLRQRYPDQGVDEMEVAQDEVERDDHDDAAHDLRQACPSLRTPVMYQAWRRAKTNAAGTETATVIAMVINAISRLLRAAVRKLICWRLLLTNKSWRKLARVGCFGTNVAKPL